MDFSYSKREIEFKDYVDNIFSNKIKPQLSNWNSANTTPREMFELIGNAELLGFRYNSSMAKLVSTEEALRISLWATELFGARGVLES